LTARAEDGVGVEAAGTVRLEGAARTAQALFRHRIAQKEVRDGRFTLTVPDVPYRPLPSLTVPYRLLEQPANARLELAWIAQPAADRAVEIEQQAAVCGIAEVVASGDIENLDQRLDVAACANVEGPRETNVPREVRVVLPE